jgi:hypothetical protein
MSRNYEPIMRGDIRVRATLGAHVPGFRFRPVRLAFNQLALRSFPCKRESREAVTTVWVPAFALGDAHISELGAKAAMNPPS